MKNTIKKFKKILIAIDLTKESDVVMRTALSIGQEFSSEMHVFVDFTPVENVIENASDNLKNLANHYPNAIVATNQYTPAGRPATEIRALAEKIKADLIVIGTHGRGETALSLGSTANSVLHGSKCDVLAVRVDPTRH